MEPSIFITVLLVIAAIFAVGYLYTFFGEPTINITGPDQNANKATTSLKIFFNNNKMDPEISCNKVFPVERIVPQTQTPATKALELLFEGPNASETEEGFFTSINPGVKIQTLSIQDGVAKADFDEQLEFQVGGSCRVSAIRSEITETLKQFPTVNSVIISIDGRTEDILQP